METVNIHQAKTNRSRLLSRVALGEEIVISNRGVPIAKLVPFWTAGDRRSSWDTIGESLLCQMTLMPPCQRRF
ncbi:MAG: type II toxin-antitoxin system Phd/YefM family antitoxin [Leptolyngbya sp. BL-A-14]